eukprot:TRINITY_DN6571_c0_g1_i1.p1 TRINITY_DN6571_c0_g1~~TRINITY_DN6571_c0_g1_i1.p1  ORF type:complete len:485 (+),score=135.79 TRINITY_DN6571_c0_g1_i1:277-1731(+)
MFLLCSNRDVLVGCDFKASIEMEYYFERAAPFRFIVYHVEADVENYNLDEQKVLGTVDIPLGEIVRSKKGVVEKPLLDEKNLPYRKAVLTIRAKARHDRDNRVVRMKLRGRNLTAKDFFGKSDPYYEVLAPSEDGSTSTLVYRSEAVIQNLNPSFFPANVNILKALDGDLDRHFIIKLLDWDFIGGKDSLGQCSVTVNELLNVETFGERPLTAPSGRVEGQLLCEHAELVNEATILDYLLAGCGLQFAVAIDFSGSNGDPKKPGTLHHREKNQPNGYQKAMQAFGKVLIPSDSDQKIGAWGFGAKPPGENVVNNCFPLNLDDGHVVGLQGLENTYLWSFSKLTLSGPTHLQPLIQQAVKITEKYKNDDVAQNYMILVILTDGGVMDMEQTIEELIKASSYPLSIIIVGIGSADFSELQHLNGILTRKGVSSARDMVQFVSFASVDNDGDRLVSETLVKIPKQFITFMKEKRLFPLNTEEKKDDH